MDSLGGLRRLTAEVADDLQQLEAIAKRLAGYETQLAEADCSAEVAGFVGVLLHRWYTAAEAALERIERTLVGAVPAGEAWHQDLLRVMALEVPDARPPILVRDTVTSLLPYLRFRHFLRHAYAVELDSVKLHALVTTLDVTQAALTADLDRFVAATRTALRRASETSDRE